LIALLLLAPIAIVALHVVLGQHNAQRARDEWESILQEASPAAVEVLAQSVRFDAVETQAHTEGALAAHARGDLPEAIRLLRLSYAVIQEAAPDRSQRLEAMGRLIRMAIAVTPVEPVATGSLRLPSLTAVAALATPLHYFLIHPAERFWLRVRVLRVGFWLAFRVLTRSLAEATVRPAAGRAWTIFDAGASDWRCLDREHLETFRAFAKSIRLRRPGLVAREGGA